MASVTGAKAEGSGRSSNEVHPSMRQTGRPFGEPNVGMSFDNDPLDRRPDPLQTEPRSARWSADDARRDDYWRGYYDRKRREAERERERASEYYPEYPRPTQRYLEYPDESSAMYRSGSRASRVPGPYPLRNRQGRPFSEMPKKIPVELEDDDYDEVYIVRGDKRGPPTEHFRRQSDSSSEMRIPYTKWMSKTLKGHFVAAMGEFVGTSRFTYKKPSIRY